MNLEHVSVESSHVPHPRHPAQVNQSTTFPPQDTEASCQLQTKKSNIDQILTKLSDKGLSAKEHAKAYLHDMYRRNCRPNTIRTNSGSIILFLAFLKHLGKARLETVSREDISAFVEHEQDRGLSGRNTARATLGGELPIRALSVARRVPNSTLAHVSASPLLIPDGRISRVRLAAVATFPEEPSHPDRG
jgi:hypothetical protein